MSGRSRIGASSIGPPSAESGTFTDLNVLSQTQANALLAPADVPAVDTLRVVRDAGGTLALWYYSTTDAAWKGVQLA